MITATPTQMRRNEYWFLRCNLNVTILNFPSIPSLCLYLYSLFLFVEWRRIQLSIWNPFPVRRSNVRAPPIRRQNCIIHTQVRKPCHKGTLHSKKDLFDMNRKFPFIDPVDPIPDPKHSIKSPQIPKYPTVPMILHEWTLGWESLGNWTSRAIQIFIYPVVGMKTIQDQYLLGLEI